MSTQTTTLKATLAQIIKDAMKSQNKVELGFARSFHAAIRKQEIGTRVDLDDAGIQKIAQTLCKQREDSITQFKAGGRQDLVDAETAEKQFLERFLPAQMSEVQLEAIVRAAVQQAGAKSAKDMGKVMPLVMAEVKMMADGKRISQWVKRVLEEVTTG